MERERITISIKRDLLKKIDKTIDGTVVRNRSHAIEHLVNSSLGTNNTENAVILAGGKNASKMLPIIKESLLQLSDNGFNKAYIALGQFAGNIKEALNKDEDVSISIEYLEEGEGSGGALLPLKRRFKNTFLVINPSENLPASFTSLIEYHKNHKALATVATENLEDLRGAYVFEPEIFNRLPQGFSMLEEDIFPELIDSGELIVYPLL